jgi:ubiquitin
MTTTYVHALTEYEIEACNRDAAKRGQGYNDDECSQMEDEVNPYDQQSETYSHIFTAAPGAPAAKIERRAELDAEIAGLETEIAAAKTKRNNKLAAMDAEIAALEAEITAHRRH